ncbi:uncharacterized protein EV420DRAFT_1545228, partial [Desarmillaria tabescens]
MSFNFLFAIQHRICTFVFSCHCFMMCRRRQVRNVYLQCGHAVNLPEIYIRCEESNCKFSIFHPASCKAPACLRTCWQYHRYPEQYSPHIDSYCPSCSSYQQSR